MFLSNWNCLTDSSLYGGPGCLGHSGITNIVKLTPMGFPGRSVLSAKKEYYQEIGLLQSWQFGLSFKLNLHPSQVNLLLRLLLCTWNFYEDSTKPHPFTLARLPTTHVPCPIQIRYCLTLLSSGINRFRHYHCYAGCSAAKLLGRPKGDLAHEARLSKLET